MKTTKKTNQFIKVENSISMINKKIKLFEIGKKVNFNIYYSLLDKKQKLIIKSTEIYESLTLEEKEYLFMEFGYDIY